MIDRGRMSRMEYMFTDLKISHKNILRRFSKEAWMDETVFFGCIKSEEAEIMSINSPWREDFLRRHPERANQGLADLHGDLQNLIRIGAPFERGEI